MRTSRRTEREYASVASDVSPKMKQHLMIPFLLLLSACSTFRYSASDTRAHLQDITVPTVCFTNSPLIDAISFLHDTACSRDPRGLRGERYWGFNFMLKSANVDSSARVNFSAHDANMYQVLTGMCTSAGATLRLFPRDVLIIEEGIGQQDN
jgi:hypothetical protein